LVARWRAELASIGWTPDRLVSSVDAASGARVVGEPSRAELHRVLGVRLADDGPLARMKVFSRRHLLVEFTPHLYGWEPRLVEAVAARGLADPEVLPLVGVAGAIEPVHALASVVAREEVIAERIAARLDRTDAPVAAAGRVAAAVADTEIGIGGDRAGIVSVRHAHDRLLTQATRPGRPPTALEGTDAVCTALATGGRRAHRRRRKSAAPRTSPRGQPAVP